MKTLRKMKKGFTIVELVIVIAVIAVLTAILVPTFISISNKANEASDKSLVKNLNTALRMAEGDQGKKNDTMHDAVLDVEEYAGIKLSQYVSKTGDEILWDSVTDEFVWKAEKPAGRADHLLWTIAKTYVSSAQTFSMYAGNEWTAAKSIDGLKVGFDVGFHKDFESIDYVGTDSNKTVTIRTYGGTLSIDASTETIKHFEYLEHLDVTAVSTTESYHEFGYLKSLDSFVSGHFVAEPSAKFEQTRNALKTVLGTNTNNLDSVYDDHFGVEDPYQEPERVEITQANYNTVFSDNPDSEYFILKDKLTLASTWYIFAENISQTHIDINLNEKNIVSSNEWTGGKQMLMDIQGIDLSLSNGGVVNNNTGDQNYNISGGNCTLTATKVNFGGASTDKIGIAKGTVVLRLDECEMNDGYISGMSTTIIFECVGTFLVSGPDFEILRPTVDHGEGYEITSDSGWKPLVPSVLLYKQIKVAAL